jgi:hypothetical protein
MAPAIAAAQTKPVLRKQHQASTLTQAVMLAAYTSCSAAAPRQSYAK